MAFNQVLLAKLNTARYLIYASPYTYTYTTQLHHYYLIYVSPHVHIHYYMILSSFYLCDSVYS